ncbi:hypothetical protein PT015_12970 [Candidatus Mycobacterium wuenschmannii]|uniref:Uncharacterized protein n=1 Tax=Candidatus Mycobacterium wuenschmannii TaxID=3027808 RepID=A0ABY8VQF4_9MYCO|nr:hypothetical protein [Candidatus Mycobacterium wuenschmannii]WIM85860.1 hypothetical protein PT015_12970 [Candidatus Mycobacterium wuenschmannii]
MFSSEQTEPCYLVEWYQPDLVAMSFNKAVERLQRVADAARVRLLGALTAPSDDTIYGVIAADSAEAAIEACHQAGWHADRVTAVVRAQLPA